MLVRADFSHTSTFVSLIAVPIRLSSRIIMVLAWIYRNIFALYVVLQVGSLWQSTGGGSRRVRGARGNTRDRGGEVSAKPTW
jgi:hypothetical protein